MKAAFAYRTWSSGPDKLPGGGTYDQPVISFDAFATALAAAGVAMPNDKKMDAVDLLPHLTGAKPTAPHTSLHWRRAQFGSAIRQANWKLIQPPGKPAELYDLAADLGETTNLASQHPDHTQRLTAALASWESELIAPVFLGSSVKNEDWGPGGANQPKKKQ